MLDYRFIRCECCQRKILHQSYHAKCELTMRFCILFFFLLYFILFKHCVMFWLLLIVYIEYKMPEWMYDVCVMCIHHIRWSRKQKWYQKPKVETLIKKSKESFNFNSSDWLHFRFSNTWMNFVRLLLILELDYEISQFGWHREIKVSSRNVSGNFPLLFISSFSSSFLCFKLGRPFVNPYPSSSIHWVKHQIVQFFPSWLSKAQQVLRISKVFFIILMDVASC